MDFQGGPWSDPLEVVSGAGVPDPPKQPQCVARSAHSAMVSWEGPVNNGATITEYRLEWQQKPEQDFSQVRDFASQVTSNTELYNLMSAYIWKLSCLFASHNFETRLMHLPLHSYVLFHTGGRNLCLKCLKMPSTV